MIESLSKQPSILKDRMQIITLMRQLVSIEPIMSLKKESAFWEGNGVALSDEALRIVNRMTKFTSNKPEACFVK